MAELTTIPLFGSKRYRLNRKKAREDGYRIFRATHSCGCCTIDMAFLTLESVRIQFNMPKFADTVRDDMGIIHECVNTGLGFREVKMLAKKTTPVVNRAMRVSSLPPQAQPQLGLSQAD